MNNLADKPLAELLATPAQYIPGVGPRKAQLFERLGLAYLQDFVFFFPRDYHDLSNLKEIPDLVEGELQSIRGVIEETELRSRGYRNTLLGVLIRQGDHHLRAVWFNQAFLHSKFKQGQHVMLFGKPRLQGNRWEMAHPRVDILEDEQDQPDALFQPVYPLTEGLSQYHVRKAISAVLELCADRLEEVFPAALLEQYDLIGIQEAIKNIHFPETEEQLHKARHRLIFQELLILQLALAIRRQQQQLVHTSPELPCTAKIDARIRRLLPFQLTAGQEQVIAEITADMASDLGMNRLLQGDVGSGKTICAIFAMMVCVAQQHQAVLMAPTEILARQHERTLRKTLAASQVRIGLLTGGMSRKERDVMLADIRSGDIDLVVGTHAILESDVQFARLGLVVIDEQHKFGVRQRAALRQAGIDPHYLVMTATPIPRTVTMTIFGDLDVSSLKDRPPGRQEIHTYLIEPDGIAKWWEFVRKKLRAGNQAYVVTPLVDASDNFDLENAEQSFEQLTSGELEAFRVDMIHGRMSAQEKDTVMQDFVDGKTDVLVATSVIEVGVDVPRATVMTILSAERFGLAQLHQLRGRISRGTTAGFCGVLAGSETEQSQQRLQTFVNSTDGFHLAEVDFRIRGPGNLLGTEQHGMPPLRVADLIEDAQIVADAREKAQQLTEASPGLRDEQLARLRKMVIVRYAKALELGDVG